MMPTHAIRFASAADEIVIMKRGRVVKKGAFRDICNSQEFQEISMKEHKKEEK